MWETKPERFLTGGIGLAPFALVAEGGESDTVTKAVRGTGDIERLETAIERVWEVESWDGLLSF